MQVPFGEWLPDQPPHLNPGANVATNVYYALNSYKRFPSLVDYSSNNIGAYFNYLTSFNMYQRTINNPFATPVQVYSNVNNGMGIFAGGTLTSWDVQF